MSGQNDSRAAGIPPQGMTDEGADRQPPLSAESVRSPAMKEVLRKARLVAQTRTTVLIVGETGTGKGVIARRIHAMSSRAGRQVVSVHCGAIPDNLIESELFGHEKGAFTGAFERQIGRFEAAHQGTIFLDEVGTLSGPAQIKLLQVLQERQFQRVGGRENIAVDVRIIAASNVDLEALCRSGQFRQDLFFRLNVFPIELPPLRERPEDIPGLVRAFLAKLQREHVRGPTSFRRDVLRALCHYPWQGNVRELENVIERAFILENSDRLTLDSLPAEVRTPRLTEAIQEAVDTTETLAEARKAAVEAFERSYLTSQLRRHQGRIGRTADACGISPRQLHKLMSRYALHKEDFKRHAGE